MKNFQGIKICLYLPFKYYNTFNNAMFQWFWTILSLGAPERWLTHTFSKWATRKRKTTNCKLDFYHFWATDNSNHSPLSVANSWRNIKLSLLLFPVGSLNLSDFSSSSSPSAVHLFLAPQRYLRVTIRSHSSRRSKDQTALGLNGTFPFGWSDARYVPRFKHCSLLPHTLTNSFSISSTL